MFYFSTQSLEDAKALSQVYCLFLLCESLCLRVFVSRKIDKLPHFMLFVEYSDDSNENNNNKFIHEILIRLDVNATCF